MSEASFVYITTSSPAEAEKIGAAMVEARLVACANILPGITSLFWWEGKVQRDLETVLILKTRSELVQRVTEEVKRIHSYDCPCVIAMKIADGNQAFLQWIDTETSG